MHRKKQESIPDREYTPPLEYDSEPDSEAMRLRRRREGFSFSEAVGLLERFLKGAEQKIDETEGYYSRPGKLLTHEEMYAFDRKILGIAAIRRRVGEKMKELEEDSWKELEEILEGGGNEDDRDEKRFSYLLTIVPPSRDPASVIEHLKINDFPYTMEPTFEGLAPFAKTYAIKEETAEKQEDELEQKRLAELYNEEIGNSEVKKDVKQEKDGQMGEGDEKGRGLRNEGVKFRIHPELKRRRPKISEEIGFNEPDFRQNVTNLDFHDDFDGMNDFDELDPPLGDLEPNDVGFYSFKVKFSCLRDEPPEGEMKRRKSGRVAKPKRFYGDFIDFGAKSPESERFQKEEQREERVRHSRRILSGEAEGDDQEEQEDGELDETVDKDDAVDDDSPEKKCPVDGCSEKLPSSEDLIEHMKNHLPPLLCGVCKRVCQRRDRLREHYRTHTGEKPHKCGICKKGFSRPDHLKRHQLTHTGERPFACDVCDYKTGNLTHLTYHRRVHTGEKPFSCSVCHKFFIKSSNVNRHMQTHTGERPFGCDICGHKFSQSFDLKTHKRSHTGEKPYSCTNCGYNTAYQSDLSKHKKRYAH